MNETPKSNTAGVQKGQTLQLRCEGCNSQGAGIAQVEGHVEVALTRALPGDQVLAQIDHVSPHTKAGVRHAWGHVLAVQTPGPHHVEPFCPKFGSCGGCLWQHMAYKEQLLQKAKFVTEAFAQRGLEGAVVACVPSPVTRAYRNQAKYVVDAKAHPVRLGGYAPRSHTVVDLVDCALVETPITNLINSFKAQFSKHVINDVRHVVVRANALGQTLLTLVVRSESSVSSPVIVALAHQLVNDVAGLAGVVANINSDDGDVIFGDRDIVVYGNATIADEIAGVAVQLSPRAFFQVNRHVAHLAYEAIAGFAATFRYPTVVWDVYAGVGTIAQVVAARVPSVTSVYCVEVRATAVESARAAWKDKDGVQFVAVAADAANALDGSIANPDLVVLNPPRAGCDARVLQQVAARAPAGIAYLSCNPQTLARDLKVLVAGGYHMADTVPYDMMPHTPHVETLVTLRRV